MPYIKDKLATIGTVILLTGVVLGIGYVGTLKGCKDEPDYADQENDNPRKRVEKEKVYYNDSVFVISTQIDTAYKLDIHSHEKFGRIK